MARPPRPGDPRPVRVELGPLSAAAVTDLVTDLLGEPPSPALLASAAGAGGNPALLVALVTGLREEGRLDATGDDLPARVRALVAQRLDGVSARCRDLLRVGAVLGRAFAVRDAAVMMRETAATLLPTLDEALAAGILGSHAGRLGFAQELVWRAVLDSIPAPVRADLAAERPALAEPVVERVELSETERAIAGLVHKGLTNRQIARRVHLSPHTVNYHLRRIFRKLDIRSRVELARLVGPA